MSTAYEIVNNYLDELINVIDDLPRDDLMAIIDTLMSARKEGRTIYVCGNGGSAATANHMVCDLSKNTRREDAARARVIGLTSNTPTITAYANDEGLDKIFAEPIISLMKEGDVLIAISGSGNSTNVLRGVEAAKEKGAYTIGLAGYSGGKLKDMVDLCLVVPADNLEHIEDLHMVITHVLTRTLREA